MYQWCSLHIPVEEQVLGVTVSISYSLQPFEIVLCICPLTQLNLKDWIQTQHSGN